MGNGNLRLELGHRKISALSPFGGYQQGFSGFYYCTLFDIFHADLGIVIAENQVLIGFFQLYFALSADGVFVEIFHGYFV